MKYNYNVLNKKIIFLLAILLSESIAWGYLIFVNPEVINNYFVTSANFSDFLTPIQKDRLHTYVEPWRSNYPPLANLFYLFLQKVGIANHYEDYISDTFIGLFLLIFVGVSILFIYEMDKRVLSNGNQILNCICIFSILSSGPFLFLLSRCNNILIVLPLVTFYILNYESENKVLKELSLLSLALATAIKIYPVIFVLLQVKKKNTKTCFRTGIYIMVLFFTPFLVYGKGSIENFLLNIVHRDEHYPLNHTISASACIQLLYSIINDGKLCSEGCLLIIKGIALVVLLYIFIVSNEKWKKIFALTLLSIWLWNGSFLYNIVFLSISLLFFLNGSNKTKKIDYIYLVLYIAMFSITFLPDIRWLNDILYDTGLGKVSWSIVIPNAAILLFLVTLFFDTLLLMIKSRKKINLEIGENIYE